MFPRNSFRLIANIRFYSSATGKGSTITVKNQPSTPTSIKSDVPGLSAKIVKVPNSPVGPGAAVSGQYKVPEYYCYDKMSYHEAEIEMAQFRCPQPSAYAKQ